MVNINHIEWSLFSKICDRNLAYHVMDLLIYLGIHLFLGDGEASGTGGGADRELLFLLIVVATFREQNKTILSE